MCILCVIQKWSRRAATMLPWLVIPLIGLWALSQLFPPAFRFEITSPRLACVFVLLVTLFWYEILMPQLSSWRVRRNARIRERKRLEAIEMQKLRKTATRRCRNCLTPYRDQNPGGGRFMCSYCGHNSKRPVLDLFVPPGVGVMNTGAIKDLVCKGGKVCSENSLICSQDWSENGNWVGGSFTGKSAYWNKSGGAFFGGGDDHCMAEQSYFGVFTFACKLMTSFFLSIRWLLGKIFGISLWRDDDSSDAKNRGMLAMRGENGAELHENKSDKARRKAEEKRQARLEKELLEEEERKQREEVTRLVEERRRLRDEKMEAEKDRGRGSVAVREKDNRKEAEQKRHERRKDKDKGSSKSNSDVEELEKKAGKENDRKQDFDKKTDSYRKENLTGPKSLTSNNYIRANAGTRYLDRMKGSFLSSSKAFGGGSFFGRGANMPATVSKESRSNAFVEHAQSCVNKKELSQPSVGGKVNMDADDKHSSRPVSFDRQPMVTPKKTWQQLFTGSSTVPPSSYSNVISRPNQKSQSEVQSLHISSQSFPTQTLDNTINFGLPSPFTQSNFSEGSTISGLNFPSLNESMLPRVGELLHESPLQEEPEYFEDPCYVPDPVYLLGPVSKSLDSFQLDIGLDKPRSLISEVNRPSPIESPLSRLKMADEKYNGYSRFSSTLNSKAQDKQASPLGDSKSSSETGTWHMWNSSPLVQDGLGLVNGTASWLSPQEKSRSHMEDFLHPSSYRNTASLFTKEELDFTSTQSHQQVFLNSCQTSGGMLPSLFGGVTDHDPLLEKALSPRLSSNEHHFPLNSREEASKKMMMFGNPHKCATNQPVFDPPFANSLSKKENGSMHGSGEDGVRSPSAMKPHIVGGLYCNPDVHSLWSYD